MVATARYAHTNIVARDWKQLARFYEQVFGCVAVPPERDLAGEWLDRATGLSGARIRGVHLRLPGHGEQGPTLEIFEYDREEARAGALVNRPGLAHLAFAVDDVGATRKALLRAGGAEVGETVSVEVAAAGIVTFAYLRDPEGNIIEVQRWSRPRGTPEEGPGPSRVQGGAEAGAPPEHGRLDRGSLQATIEQWMRLWKAPLELADFDRLHHAAFVDHSPAGRDPGREGFRRGLEALFRVFPDFDAVAEDILVDEDKQGGAARWSATGTHAGEFQGFSATGRRIRFRGIETVGIQDGRIIERWGEWDAADLAAQLG